MKEKSGSVSREVFECLKRQQKNLIKMSGQYMMYGSSPVFNGFNGERHYSTLIGLIGDRICFSCHMDCTRPLIPD